MIDGETKPPPLLSEADLIGLMEKHGIGKVTTQTQQRYFLVVNSSTQIFYHTVFQSTSKVNKIYFYSEVIIVYSRF